MSIASADVAGVITAVGGVLTVLGGFVIQIVMMLRQNRKMEANHSEVKSELADIRSATSTHKTLPDA